MAHIKLKIPTLFRKFTADRSQLQLQADTIKELLHNLREQEQELSSQLFSSKDELNAFVNIFVGGQHIRKLQGLETKLSDGQEVMIITAIAGG